MSPKTGEFINFPDVPKLELDQLIDQLIYRAQDVKRAQGRLRALLGAIETITSDLSIETVLHNIVSAACELAGALVVALAMAAGASISNARLYHESQMQQRWQGASAEISSAILAEKTIKNYVSSLLGKLGVERRTQAAVFGAEARKEHEH